MLSILIIDDTEDKRKDLREFLTGRFPEIHQNDIDEAETTTEGLDKIVENQYDLVLLDLFIKNRKGGNPDPQNAINLLDQIHEMKLVNCPAHILGITRMTEINETQKATFDNYLWSLLFYGEEYNGWESKLEAKIRYLIKSKLQLSGRQSYNYDVAIVNALQELENGMIRSWTDSEWKKVEMPIDTSTNYYETVLEPEGRKIRCITTYADRMGMTASAVLTTKIINIFRPRYIFMTGISACVSNKKAGVGDIIVAQSVIDGASGKYSVEDKEHVFVPDYQSIETNPDFISIINRLKENDELLTKIRKTVRANVKAINADLKIHTGPVASVPAVIADKDVIEDIKGQERKLLGLEMEAYGMYYAASHSVLPHPKFCAVLKSATDFADEHKGDEYQPYGAMTSAELLYHIVMNDLDYER